MHVSVQSVGGGGCAVPYLDSLGIKRQAFFLVDQKFLNVFALIPLELNHLTHLSVVDDSAIAS